MNKKLYKSEHNKIIAGVIGGMGEYFSIDATLLRLAYLVLTVLTGLAPCIIVYIIAAMIVPKAPETKVYEAEPVTENKSETV